MRSEAMRRQRKTHLLRKVRRRSAHDHADLALVPDIVKGGGVFPVLVGLAAVVIIVRIAHKIAARRIVAVDEDGVVVVDEALQLSVDPVVAIAWLLHNRNWQNSKNSWPTLLSALVRKV